MVKKIVLLLLLFTTAGCSDESNNQASFIRAVDGDTLIATIDGKEEYIRLLLVDTPETKHPDKEIQAFGPEASKLMKNTFSPSDPIQLEFGTEKRDKYDRLLAYVYTAEGQMFNKTLLKKGLARVAYVYPPNDKYVEQFREIEKEARQQDIGIWSVPEYVTDDGFNSDILPKEQSAKKVPYNAKGQDRDCSDFKSQKEAQAFFKAAGGPKLDPHRLDGEGDGIVCEGL